VINGSTICEPSLHDKIRNLHANLKLHAPILIAYSGGVDSTFLLHEASRELGDGAVGIIADSPSLPRRSLAEALENAKIFGARVEVVATAELSDPRYSSNPANRCYFCKLELFGKMQRLALERGFAALAYGENADDALLLRPGAMAASEFRVIAPLRSAGLTKMEIRLLSHQRGLPTADQPAQPCLSSRIAHGTEVTRDALLMVEKAEEFVRSAGFSVFRVRYAANQRGGEPEAKLQIAVEEMGKLGPVESKIRENLGMLGFREVKIDPNGYRPPAAVR
jgi:pyridinium-3,5-biscarboxylic acid mononucleotide sulfurtransferase